MTLKKALIAAIITVAYLASLLFAYYRGRIDHEVSREEFVAIAETVGTAYGASTVWHDANRAYVVRHQLFPKGDYLYSTELAALPPDFRSKLTSGIMLK